VDGLVAQSPSGAWSFGGAVLTVVFPMLLFIAVAATLYILYTKPEVIPGHRAPARPVSYTAIPGEPTAVPGDLAVADKTKADESENATPEGV
jgi:hypothetical protein